MGKTTFAKRLSKKLGIRVYSTDDVFYVKKYTKKRSENAILKKINEIVAKDSFILEGSTRRILRLGLEPADVIFYFRSTSLLRQYYLLFTRKDSSQNLFSLLSLSKYLFCKHFGILGTQKVSYESLLKPYRKKVITFTNFSQVDEYLKKMVNNNKKL
ncbi:MAG: hypothetical protein ACMXYF_05420 [Candidatus Woesearchaeota archaeon]